MPRLNNFKKSIANKNDELYTPKILADIIIPYIDNTKTVWCPFDTENSEIVIALKENGNNVITTHLNSGQDFRTYTPNHFDQVISNPPFSIKLQVFDKLYKLGKPFAMIMGLPVLNYQEVGEFFLDKSLQLLIPDKKVSFDGSTASFNNSYFCHNLLPQSNMFVHLPHNNTGNNFIPSRMYREMYGEDYINIMNNKWKERLRIQKEKAKLK